MHNLRLCKKNKSLKVQNVFWYRIIWIFFKERKIRKIKDLLRPGILNVLLSGTHPWFLMNVIQGKVLEEVLLQRL